MKKNLVLFLFLITFLFSYSQPHQGFIGDRRVLGTRVVVSSEEAGEIGGNTLDSKSEIYLSGQEEASRFLAQATFGPTMEEIGRVTEDGFSKWIDSQLNIPPSLTTPLVYEIEEFYPWFSYPPRPRAGHFKAVWWHTIISSKDQLRQRVAFALSQIFVIGLTMQNETGFGFSAFYDLLVDDAFGNFRDLLYNISLHPKMGWYLGHLNNAKSNPEEGTEPDENFARELMQLFSIGLFELNLNGTLKLDGNGNPIPTYDNEDIQELAKVFTGLGPGDVRPNAEINYGYTEPEFGYPYYLRVDPLVSMAMYEEHHETKEKTVLKKLFLPSGQSGLEDISQAIDFLFNHPNVGPFIGYRLIQRLVKSNPSPEYVERVATAFNDNGQGVRGDMKAVIKAILLDPEARECKFIMDDQNSKLKEPILRYSQMLRAFHVEDIQGWYATFGTDLEEDLKQNILSSSSVFNFYSPDYTPPGEMSNLQLVGPEYQILNTVTSISYFNLVNKWTNQNSPLEIRIQDNNTINRSMLTLDDEVSIIDESIEKFVDRLDLLLCHGLMTNHTRSVVVRALQDLKEENGGNSFQDSLSAVKLGLYLVMISPDYVIIR